MFLVDFQEEKGWHDPRIEPYGPFSLDPATAVLHYAQAIFDGLKAFRGVDGKIRLFRPQKHVERMNNSARRLCIPPLDPDLALQSHRSRLVDVDRDWVPTHGGHLALHPSDRHRQRAVPRRAAGQVVHLLRHPLAGGRLLPGGHGPGEDPGGRTSTCARSTAGWAGQRPPATTRPACSRPRRRKHDGLHPGAVARRRAPQVPRRGRHHEHHGEDRRRDHHPAADRDDPARRHPRFAC